MKKHLLTIISIAAITFASCEKEADSDENGSQNTNPYNTAFNVVVKTPITEADSVYDEIIWNTADARALGEGDLKVINAKDLTLSSFTLGAFNISTGTQTVLAPSFIHKGQVQDLSDGITGVIDIQSVDEVNQLISGTYEYSFVKYFQSSTVTYTISRTGELKVTFNNVHYN